MRARDKVLGLLFWLTVLFTAATGYAWSFASYARIGTWKSTLF